MSIRNKNDLLLINVESIELLLQHLYSIEEQLALINSSLGRKVSISDVLYKKFLQENMSDEYELWQKNKYFASKNLEIVELCSKYLSYQEQFNHLSIKTFDFNGSIFNLMFVDI